MREMKDSGIEWIGEIPVGWGIIKNKYLICTLYSGGTPSATNEKFYCSENGIPFVSISDMSNCSYVEHTKKQITEYGLIDKQLRILPVGTILYSIYATVGAISELKIEAAISQAMLAIQLISDVDKAFYKYNLVAMRDYIYSNASGNTQFNLNAEKVLNFVFVFPPLEEQHRISTYLDTKCEKIDSIIARQQEVIEKLKAYKLSVITEAVTKGLNPDVRMKDSGVEWIGDVPEHWEITKFKYLSLEIGDGIHTTPEYDLAGSIYFINGNNIGFDNLVFKDNTNTINEDEYKKYKPSLLTTDTILITLNGATYGKTSFYNGEKVLLGKSAGYITLKPTENKRFLRYYLQSNAAKLIMEISLLGSTIANLSLNTLKNFSMSYPPKNEQCEIVEYLDKKCSAIDSAIAKKQAIIEKLTAYKKSLIFEVVTGKREV